MIHHIDTTHAIVHSMEVPPYIIVTPPSHLNPDPKRFIHLLYTGSRLCWFIICEMRRYRDTLYPYSLTNITITDL